jgi:hypothetical protein
VRGDVYNNKFKEEQKSAWKVELATITFVKKSDGKGKAKL